MADARFGPGYTSAAGLTFRAGGTFGRVPRATSVSVRFQANSILRLVRDIQGKFEPANGPMLRALADANLHMAMVVQAGMATELDRQVKATGRPQAARYGKGGHKQGALRESLLASDNRFVNASGFLVLRPDFMNRSPAARYWRRIEEGGPAFQAKGWFFPAMSIPGTTAPRQLGQFPSKHEKQKVFWPDSVPWRGKRRATGKGPFAPSSTRYRKDARFPQDRDNPRAFWTSVGPFPAYRYTQGGHKALAAINKEDIYTLRLLNAGIRVTPRMMRNPLWGVPALQ